MIKNLQPHSSCCGSYLVILTLLSVPLPVTREFLSGSPMSLCAPACSGRVLFRTMNGPLSKLSPRLPQSSAIPPPLRLFCLCLCLITSLVIWLQYVPIGLNPNCCTLTYCSSVCWPDRSHVRCITFVMWGHNGAVRNSLIIPAVPCHMLTP